MGAGEMIPEARCLSLQARLTVFLKPSLQDKTNKMWIWQWALWHPFNRRRGWWNKRFTALQKWWPTKDTKQVPFITPASEIDPWTNTDTYTHTHTDRHTHTNTHILNSTLKHLGDTCHSHSMSQQCTSSCVECFWCSEWWTCLLLTSTA